MDSAYTTVNTRFGWIIIGASNKRISFLTLPQPSLQAAFQAAGELSGCAFEESPDPLGAFGDLPLKLEHYFNGEHVEFPEELDLDDDTSFHINIWNLVRTIPYAEVKSYKWVAERAGRPSAYRAVGQALAHNRFPIVIPCHRVLSADGNLGGFSGGLELKRRLLELEAKTACSRV